MADLPDWALWLDVPFTPDGNRVRHRVLFGGRGGAKSWTIAHKLVERAILRPERILCAREFLNSLRESSKKLIEDVIRAEGFDRSGNGFFTSSENEIRGRNGSAFVFAGLNGREAAIKSFEGFTLAWVEEAATVSQLSIDALIPTIRQPHSEIWWSYNPRHASDPVDQLFRGANVPPPGSIVIEVGFRDNPWFPDVLRRDLEYDQRRDPDKYAHIWEGQYVRQSEARVFANWSVAPFVRPEDAIVRFGADWGYSVDPTVLVRCFIGRWAGTPGNSSVIADPLGTSLFVDYEAYMVGCEIDDMPALFAGSDVRSPPRWSNDHAHAGIEGVLGSLITADSARPETIAYLQNRGFRIEPAIKGKGSIEDGISFLKSFDIWVHPRCRQTIVELTHYTWKVDPITSAVLPQLADANNHVIDALRYALEGVRRAGTGKCEWASTGRRLSMGAWGAGDHEIMPGLEDYVDPNRGWGTVPSRRGFRW